MIHKLKTFIPRYGYLPIITLFAFNSLIYFLTKLAFDPTRACDLSLGADSLIPFVPAFILFYVLAYPQWVLGYIMIARESREKIHKIVTVNVLSKIICGIIFLAIPTVMVRAEITGGGVFTRLTSLIYAADTPAVNLFPSIHCLESWAVFRCSLKLKLPIGYKIAMGIFSLGVFASVLFVKQHIILDIPAGILVFELAYLTVHLTKLDQRITNLFHKKPSRSEST